MIIAAKYAFNGGRIIEENFPSLVGEINSIVASVDAHACKKKVSDEITMLGKVLFSPRALNAEFKAGFTKRGWTSLQVRCDYPTSYYSDGYSPKPMRRGAFREMDFIKDRVGVEVQFGKYAFMVYNVCAKMTIFHNLGHIDFGVEIVPVKALADEMSTGVSYFEQFVWDLEQRGVSNIDVPVMIYGLDAG